MTLEFSNQVSLMQDGALHHIANPVNDLVWKLFKQSRRSRTIKVMASAISPVLISADLLLWGYMLAWSKRDTSTTPPALQNAIQREVEWQPVILTQLEMLHQNYESK